MTSSQGNPLYCPPSQSRGGRASLQRTMMPKMCDRPLPPSSYQRVNILVVSLQHVLFVCIFLVDICREVEFLASFFSCIYTIETQASYFSTTQHPLRLTLPRLPRFPTFRKRVKRIILSQLFLECPRLSSIYPRYIPANYKFLQFLSIGLATEHGTCYTFR